MSFYYEIASGNAKAAARQFRKRGLPGRGAEGDGTQCLAGATPTGTPGPKNASQEKNRHDDSRFTGSTDFDSPDSSQFSCHEAPAGGIL